VATDSTGRPIISVFGSAAPLPGSPAYEEARLLGRLLAGLGVSVATGGYMGTMAGVSHGAAEAGGHVIGVTAAAIERYRPIPPNEWVMDEIRFETLAERQMHLVCSNSGIVALPGGIGTLAEMSLAWSLMQAGELRPRPLVLVGRAWRETIDAYAQTDLIRPRDMDLVYFATSAETAVSYLRYSLFPKARR
jgi:uncharacterized protein (TIGR00730 family)